jgi:hypothetical protein
VRVLFGIVLIVAVFTALVIVQFQHEEAVITGRAARDIPKAQQFWGQAACGNNIKIVTKQLGGQTGGLARTGTITLPTGEVRIVSCKITMDRRRWSETRYCAVLIHEYGHLLGHGHSSNPSDIMYPASTNRNIPQICRPS